MPRPDPEGACDGRRHIGRSRAAIPGLPDARLEALISEPARATTFVKLSIDMGHGIRYKDAAAALEPLIQAVHSATDITGFGLLGHALEMATASQVSLRIDSGNIELIQGAMECVQNGYISGGLKKNREFVGNCARFGAGISTELQNLLFDPQTSGGLLIALQPEFAEKACSLLRSAECPAARVGEVIDRTSLPIDVV